MQHDHGAYTYYKADSFFQIDQHRCPKDLQLHGLTNNLVNIWRPIFSKGIDRLTERGAFLDIVHEYMELLTSKSQGDKAVDEIHGYSTTSCFLALLINNSWMHSQAEFQKEISLPTISSNKFQMYRRARMAAVNNAKQFVFVIFRLIISNYADYYGLGKQTGQFKDVASLMQESANLHALNYNGDIAGFDSHWSSALMRLLIIVITNLPHDKLDHTHVKNFGPFNWTQGFIVDEMGNIRAEQLIDINPIVHAIIICYNEIFSSKVKLRSLAESIL